MYKSKKPINYNPGLDAEFGIDDYQPTSRSHADRFVSSVNVKKLQKNIENSTDNGYNTGPQEK